MSTLAKQIAALRAGQHVRAEYKFGTVEGVLTPVSGDDDLTLMLTEMHRIDVVCAGHPRVGLTAVTVLHDPPPPEPTGWGAVVTWTEGGIVRAARRRGPHHRLHPPFKIRGQRHWLTYAAIVRDADPGTIRVRFDGLDGSALTGKAKDGETRCHTMCGGAGMICNRALDHAGPHEAYGLDDTKVLRSWPKDGLR